MCQLMDTSHYSCIGITMLVGFSTRSTVRGSSISLLTCLTTLSTYKTQSETSFASYAAWMESRGAVNMETVFCDRCIDCNHGTWIVITPICCRYFVISFALQVALFLCDFAQLLLTLLLFGCE